MAVKTSKHPYVIAGPQHGSEHRSACRAQNHLVHKASPSLQYSMKTRYPQHTPVVSNGSSAKSSAKIAIDQTQETRPPLKAGSPLANVLPSEAPELYRNRHPRAELGERKENIVEFLRRVWGPYMEAGLLSRVALRRLDKSADAAVGNWRDRQPLPADINLPTLKELNDRAIQTGVLSVHDAGRLSSAIARRARAAKPHSPN